MSPDDFNSIDFNSRMKLKNQVSGLQEKLYFHKINECTEVTAGAPSYNRQLTLDSKQEVGSRVHYNPIDNYKRIPPIPGLQRVSEHMCIVCGARADLYCARCSVTPYCSEHCQRRDWSLRHSAVCHNLMRMNGGHIKSPAPEVDTNTSIPPAPAPLRRPRSPNATQQKPLSNGTPYTGNENKGEAVNQRSRAPPTHLQNTDTRKFVPPNHIPPQPRAVQQQQIQRSPRNMQQNQDEERVAKDKKLQLNPASTNSDGLPTKQKTQPPKAAFEKPLSKFDIPRRTVETPKANFEAPKPNIEAPKPNIEAPKSNIETPKPNFESPKVEPAKVPKTMEMKTEAGVKQSAPKITLVPAEYVVEKLPIGEAFMASVERSTPEGFICLSMHAQFTDLYNALCTEICQGDAVVPKPGSTFAYFDPSDEGWYRARCLSATECALLDAGRLANIGQGQCRPLAANFAEIPEFCCLVKGKVEVGMSVKCTILMKCGDVYRVSIDADDTYLGEGTVTRWLPDVQIAPTKPNVTSNPVVQKFTNNSSQPAETKSTPEQKVVQIPQGVPEKKPQESSQKPQENFQKPQQNVQRQQENVQVKKPVSKLPEVNRPDIINNGRYVLLHVTSFTRACVRACDENTTKEFESIIQDVALYGAQNGKRLTEAPLPGHVVLCLFEEVHYRALVTRTKAAENRFKVEYVEYGNEEIVTLEKLFVCPPELNLQSRPARASTVSLSTAGLDLTAEATAYLDSLKEEVELIATIPTGEKTAASGSLVHLSVAKNKDNITKKLEQMCTPAWKKLEVAGGDIIDSDVVMLSDMKSLPLPTDRVFTLHITDLTSLKVGIISGYDAATPVAPIVYGPLTEKINEYCNSSLCKDPYLPAVEEVCLARLEPYPQWFRAVVIKHVAGQATASLLYIDYGNIEHDVPVQCLRKCMPEFTAQPSLASIIDIQDWPETVTDEQLVKALLYLEADSEGMGKLQVATCHLKDDETYTIAHTGLLAALRG